MNEPYILGHYLYGIKLYFQHLLWPSRANEFWHQHPRENNSMFRIWGSKQEAHVHIVKVRKWYNLFSEHCMPDCVLWAADRRKPCVNASEGFEKMEGCVCEVLIRGLEVRLGTNWYNLYCMKKGTSGTVTIYWINITKHSLSLGLSMSLKELLHNTWVPCHGSFGCLAPPSSLSHSSYLEYFEWLNSTRTKRKIKLRSGKWLWTMIWFSSYL